MKAYIASSRFGLATSVESHHGCEWRSATGDGERRRRGRPRSASDGSDDINNNSASQKENDNKTSTEQEDNKHKCDTTLKHHRVRYESDSSGVRIACFGADFELFCQFKPNTSCQDAVATTNRLSAYLKANESASFLMNY